MTNRIKSAFDSIHADEALKQRTREYLSKTVYQSGRRQTSLLRRIRPLLAATCLLVVLCVSGSYLYFTPTAFISIDVNPSLELGVNRFNRIVSVDAYNEDGQALADSLNIKNLAYQDALELVLTAQNVVAYLSNGELSLTVAGENESQCAEIYQAMEDCTSGHQNIHCHTSSYDTVKQAHAAGMSVGKYQAYLILQELDPAVTTEQIRGMTMREIYQLINTYAQEQNITPLLPEASNDEYEHDEHSCSGHGYQHGVG